MQKRFNVTGSCLPEYHYMADISEKLEMIKALVDSGAYFTINRARQYGKTTTLNALRHRLKNELRQPGSHPDVKIDLRLLTDVVIRMGETAEKPVVLMIDAVDRAGTEPVFTAFLGCL